jgi:hypothetical protein
MFLTINDPRGWSGPDGCFQADIRAIERGMDLAAYSKGDKRAAGIGVAGSMVAVSLGRQRVRPAPFSTAIKTVNIQYAFGRFLLPRETDTFDEWSQAVVGDLASAGYSNAAARLLDGLTSIPSDQERIDRLPRLIGPR